MLQLLLLTIIHPFQVIGNCAADSVICAFAQLSKRDISHVLEFRKRVKTREDSQWGRGSAGRLEPFPHCFDRSTGAMWL